MSMLVAGLADGIIPVVLDRVEIAEFRCCIPIVSGPDEHLELPAAQRPERCPARTHLFVGSAPTCAKHIRYAVSLLHDPQAVKRTERWLEENS